jgi:hypothetical protein
VERTHVVTARTRIAATLVSLCCAVGIAGCSGEDTAAPQPTRTGAPATVTARPPAEQPAGAIRELSGISCERDGNAWTFGATVRNSGKERMMYTVLVAVAKKAGGTVVGSTTLTTTLAAGDTAKIRATRFYAGRDKPADVQCVPSATKAPA